MRNFGFASVALGELASVECVHRGAGFKETKQPVRGRG